MGPKIYSSYRIANKMIRHFSNISFLRTCKTLHLIPYGLRTINLLKSTTNSPAADALSLKHSRQWLQLAIDSQYHLLEKIRRYVFPLNYQEDKQIVSLQNSLQETKQRKLQQLLTRHRGGQKTTDPKPQGFKNLSSETLDSELLNILHMGPSFINAEPRELSRLCLLSKANLQLATDRLNREHVPESAINEFKGGIARVINECEKSGISILRKKKLPYKLPPKTVVITSTDKSKRLIALDSTRYQDMVNKSTIETGNYKALKKLNLPRTEQINFNGKLNKVANKYKITDPKLYSALRENICSEPMPCPVYCLPKDHKDGDLKGRPIHAATDTPATFLSKYLAKSLNMLLRYVPAHLKNTQEFIDCLYAIDGESVHGFCSLDVCNLYGSIPLEDINPKTPSVFAVARRFFSQHKIDSELWALSDEDFETLVRLCITSDNILIGGNGYKQKSGLAMGNNLAPTLAIIYMNELDSLILDRANGCIVLKRFIDDYFICLLSQEISGESLLTIANDLNDSIKFTFELPDNGQLPFLDTMVSFNSETKTFSTTLYIKPIHSKCITPWVSHGSIASKRAILVGEIRRAVACSTDTTSRNESLRQVTKLFVNNGYPRKFVKAVTRYTLNNKPINHDEQNYIYLKLPFINEELKRRALSVIRRSGINKIKVHFMNGRPSSRVFAPPRERINCSDKCETCKSANKPSRCLTKNVVYEITCSHCGTAYIGETGRTIGSRIKEHLANDKQTVYQHLKSHKNILCDHSAITWKILHANIRQQNERKCIEAFEIHNRSDHIMNGCIGRTISI